MWSTTFPTRAKQGWIALCSWLGRSLSMDLSSCEPLLHSKDRPVALEAFKAKCPPPPVPATVRLQRCIRFIYIWSTSVNSSSQSSRCQKNSQGSNVGGQNSVNLSTPSRSTPTHTPTRSSNTSGFAGPSNTNRSDSTGPVFGQSSISTLLKPSSSLFKLIYKKQSLKVSGLRREWKNWRRRRP